MNILSIIVTTICLLLLILMQSTQIVPGIQCVLSKVLAVILTARNFIPISVSNVSDFAHKENQMRKYHHKTNPCSPLQQRNQQNCLGKWPLEEGCTHHLVMS